jgi:hypothetical protein
LGVNSLKEEKERERETLLLTSVAKDKARQYFTTKMLGIFPILLLLCGEQVRNKDDVL